MGKSGLFYFLLIVFFSFTVSRAEDKSGNFIYKNELKTRFIQKGLTQGEILSQIQHPANQPGNTLITNSAEWTAEIPGKETAPRVDKPSFNTPSGEQYIYFAVTYYDANEGNNIRLSKIDRNGEKIWERTINGPVNGNDELLTFRVVDSGDIYVLALIVGDDFLFKTRLYIFSPEGVLLSDNNIEKALSGDNPIKIGGNGIIYYLESSAENDGIGFRLEAFNSNGDLTCTYETNKYLSEYSTFLKKDILITPSGNPFITIMSSEYNILDFYMLDENLTLKWIFQSDDIPALNRSITYHNGIFDQDGNYYFAGKMANEYLRIYRINSNGNFNWVYSSASLYRFTGLAMDINRNISMVTSSLPEIYLTKLDTAGNAIIELKKETVPEERLFYNGTRFSFSSINGYFTVFNNLFDDTGTLLGAGDSVDISFTGSILLEDELPNSLKELNSDLSEKWNYEPDFPSSSESYLRGSVISNDGSLINIIENMSVIDNSYFLFDGAFFSKTTPDGNTDSNMELYPEIPRQAKCVLFQKISDNRILAVFVEYKYMSVPEVGSNSTIILAVIFDEKGKIISKREYQYPYYFNAERVLWRGESVWIVGSRWGTAEEEFGFLFKALSIDKTGNLITDREIGELNGEKLSTGYIYDIFVDAKNSLHMIVTDINPLLLEPIGADTDALNGIIEITQNGKLNFSEFAAPITEDIYNNFYYNGWDNLYLARLEQTNDNANKYIRLEKFTLTGEKISEQYIPIPDNNNSIGYLSMVRAGEDGSFAILGAPELNQNENSVYILFDKEDNITLSKQLDISIHTLPSLSPDKKNFIFTEPGSTVSVFFLDIATGEVTKRLYQTNSDGNSFLPIYLTWGPDKNFFYLSGLKRNHAYIMKFKLDNEPDYGIKPNKIVLQPAFPNPTNGQTAIRYTLPQNGEVEITIFDVLGRVVYKHSIFQESGYHVFNYQNEWLATGNYFYRIRQNGITVTGKFMIIK